MCSSYVNVLYSYINFTILDFLHSLKSVFSLFFILQCAFCASVLLLTCIYFYLLVLTGCLAPLTPWLFTAASPLIFTFNIFFVVISYFEQEWVQIKIDWLTDRSPFSRKLLLLLELGGTLLHWLWKTRWLLLERRSLLLKQLRCEQCMLGYLVITTMQLSSWLKKK